ncbi:TPA: hypothetical protein SH447_004518 [Salmonella enterica]|jgi:hypothetical protein|uniref:Uncharacterized protein n=3 Tax=root TaxID=1 RepID=A0A8S5UIV6_9CAUD|nr:MAG TPA: hypothetical protein [Myoviridae sp. ctu2j3]DAF94372.1 MAG TPA: hypothetical protein [Myoviridae sp. ctu2j3]HEH8886002.1 hypothetical protein [Salmonella enterica]
MNSTNSLLSRLAASSMEENNGRASDEYAMDSQAELPELDPSENTGEIGVGQNRQGGSPSTYLQPTILGAAQRLAGLEE